MIIMNINQFVYLWHHKWLNWSHFLLKGFPQNSDREKINFKQHFVFVQIVKIYQFILPKEGDESYSGAVLLPGNVLPPLLHQPQGRGHLRGRVHGHQRHTESELQKQPKVIYRQNECSGVPGKHRVHLLLCFLLGCANGSEQAVVPV